MGEIIGFINEKGGVAKTTTVKNLSIGLARKGKKVLTIDMDPSCNLTTSLGILENDGDDILKIIDLTKNVEAVPAGCAIIHHDEGIDFIPGSKELHSYTEILMGAVARETILRRYLNIVRDNYDFILIDCPAGLNIYVTNVLFAADSIIVPVEPQFLGVGAMQNVFEAVRKVHVLNGTGYKPDILGILFTLVRTNTNNDRSVIKYFKDEYKNKINVFSTLIPLSSRIPESDALGKSIYSYEAKSTAAMTYEDFTKEFLYLEGRRKSK